MAQASGSSQPIILRDHHFSLEDGLGIVSTAMDSRSDTEEISQKLSGHFIPSKSISRLLIERGEYPAVPICFQYPSKATVGWSEWVNFGIQRKISEEAISEAGLTIPLFISSFCDISKDYVCLRHVVRRWSPETHTFIC